VRVWRDTADLWPGEDWRVKIRRAIADDAFAFIACFSRTSVSRSKSHQNEELTLAVEQLRLRPPSRPWLIPARFDDCEIPDWDIGGGRTLASIQSADLFGDRADEAAARLVTSVLRILGQPSDAGITAEHPRQPAPSAASVLVERFVAGWAPDDRPRGVAVVLSALNVEYLAVRSYLTGLNQREHPAGTRFEVGDLADAGWQVALAATGPGNVGAAVIAERAISLLRPDVVLCVGVAGSLKENVKLGDVVVATRVDAYHGGTAAEDFLARPRTWPAPHRLDQLARELDRTGSWRRRLPPEADGRTPAVHFRPIAAGEVVLDSRQAALFAQLRLHHNDAAAIEMEGAGIAQAAHFNDSLPALVIRGISDQADGSKLAADRDGWQQRASVNAAAFAVCLLENLTPPSRPARP
jgi:nucleoside phosphorylase